MFIVIVLVRSDLVVDVSIEVGICLVGNFSLVWIVFVVLVEI